MTETLKYSKSPKFLSGSRKEDWHDNYKFHRSTRPPLNPKKAWEWATRLVLVGLETDLEEANTLKERHLKPVSQIRKQHQKLTELYKQISGHERKYVYA